MSSVKPHVSVPDMTLQEQSMLVNAVSLQWSYDGYERSIFLTHAVNIGCGSAITNGGASVSDGCTMACNGDASEMCGGSNRLTVYQYSSSGTTPPPTGTGKRGLCYNNNNPNGDATYANLFVGYDEISWGYDYGFPSYNLNSQFEL